MQAEHPGTRTYFFSSDSNEEQTEWIRAMSKAAEVTNPLPERTNPNTADLHHTMVTKEPEQTLRSEPHDITPPPPSTPSSDQEGKQSDGRQRDDQGKGVGLGPEHAPHSNNHPNGWGSYCPPPTAPYRTADKPPLSRSPSGRPVTEGHADTCVGASYQTREPHEHVVLRRGLASQTAPEKVAQRKSSMAQLQQWVNQRRGASSQEDIHSPSRYFPVTRGLSSDYYSYAGGPQYMDEYSLYPTGVRPDSICSASAVGGYERPWAVEEKRRSLRDGVYQLYKPLMPRDAWGQQYYGGMETSMRRLSIQPRSRSVPRSPSSSSGGPYSPVPQNFASPARSPSARFDRYPGRLREDVIYADPSVYSLRRSLSSPKVPPFHDVYSRELHPTLKLNEIETSKLLGRLCEQIRTLKEHEAVVHRLRMNKDGLEEALIATHQEMELYHNQPGILEQLQLRKESQQKQLINTRGELSQVSSALTTTRMEFEALEDEANAIHGDLWEQLNAGGQSELVRRHIQKEFWRVQDVLEGLHKSSSSRGTDTAKHRVASGASGSFSTNSSASPLSSVSLTSPLSPFSSVPGCQPSPTKQLGLEPAYGEQSNTMDGQEFQDRQSIVNKVGVVTPRTKSPTDELHRSSTGLTQLNGKVTNGAARERPKSAVFPAEIKSKMSVQEQNERIRRNQSNSLREKRRSLNLSGGQSPANYKVVRRRLTAHEIDIKDLEAAVRGPVQESPQEEIARLRRLPLEPDYYNISKELTPPDKVLIPERRLDVEDDAPLSPEEQKEKQKKLERIKTLIAKSNLQNVVPVLDGPVEGGAGRSCQQQLQEQEKRIEISCALAAEASRRSRLLSAQCTSSPPLSPTSLAQPSSADFPSTAHIMQV